MIRKLGRRDYRSVWQAMKDFTEQRDIQTPDELWLVEHDPVFTQGQAGKAEHLLNPGDIPVVQSDRGGQITYHGPGQLVLYVLVDLRRAKIGVRELVTDIENAIIDTLRPLGIEASSRADAPGVYTDDKKIASLGLRVRQGKTFHGLALNVDMDLEPFLRINPCGYEGLEMTQIRNFHPDVSFEKVQEKLVEQLSRHLGYAEFYYGNELNVE